MSPFGAERVVSFSQVGLVVVALREGVYVGNDGHVTGHGENTEGQHAGGSATPREVSRIAFGSCT